ncbi:intradiol ring-cleavage dioxygenase [Cupriavidus basilensis]|uniref:Intradiol ring-cleavage dioxygenase n=1 Tax=Cupriavidus basilensis TaxID=68895 RepID=A0ABT6ANT2_9BURK|nr:intradiol ring-cleavage dioxygenase [Cupriavidus basilensis]MDF3834280.1 intradiol ring-cleavage dioxygenase [Cupriavidus basilensis]
MNQDERASPAAELPYFEEAGSDAVVNSRMGAQADSRLRQVMEVFVRHLHAAVKEIEPTHAEWLAAIQFLTATGQMCNEWRQEYILLSDVLGVSMLVDAINHRRPSGATPNTILGPFYVENSPNYELGHNICLDGKGEPLIVSGRVVDTANNPVPHAKLEVWQTNNDGFYDVQQLGIQPESNLRGTFTADAEGSYWFRSVKPRHYPIPSDGPVGQLLEKIGRHPNRAAHLHFIVSAPGYEPVITHIFTPDCPYLHQDAVFGVKRELVADFRRVEDPAAAESAGLTAPFWSVAWDFTLAPLAR